ncbi:MAG TPA: hypothetical protein VLA89_15620 [Gemmatimonadales bacterium]|nr:hypothetical protein [Gemmatimonadales bacterium]
MNAFTESIRRTAELRGQHANRLEIRDPGDHWPPFVRVNPHEVCPQLAGILRHEPPEGSRCRSFCRACGWLIAGR